MEQVLDNAQDWSYLNGTGRIIVIILLFRYIYKREIISLIKKYYTK